LLIANDLLDLVGSHGPGPYRCQGCRRMPFLLC